MHRHPADNEWAERFGYSRAVRRGGVIEVSGTTGDGHDAYAQASAAYATVLEAVRALGGGPADIVRIRVMTTDIALAEQIGRAHNEIFAELRPAMSLYAVSDLIAPEMLVEIEATAVLDA
ncbi:MAG: RidA family protein [Solirubrobacteraceae bacterium]